ncbi:MULTISPECIES: EpsG family protein [unclassified Campylobacter]|uniref:EpsG family protein n=1 Tax=unclassified Campylobacter TaxID=2593542 RepID=UPI0022E9A311|nr:MULTISPECIES: EpsG family protein [unclassified Campylobacter]MDA3079227.1 EpsG family protein [Campylobacter sp. CS_NA2]MDA3080470.1 EpsG family protein [Campylobacter sp. CS_NA1]MDA3085325.1 EpsG family protein [Campylobacter sp. CS_ED1]MDA3090102.1 EpsG family protein [Campylobacter sp. CS_ED2]WBR51360.1 EpsG family protein [Campylobacter sp. CS_NA3]
MRSAILNLSLLVNPILSVFTAIFLKIDFKKHYIFVALFFGYIAMLLEPSLDWIGDKTPDVLRHYERFMEYDLRLSPFEYMTLNNQKDIFIVFEYYFGNILGIKKEILPFISVFISYYCILKIFNIIYKDTKINHINILFLTLFLIINFRGAAFGIRNYSAIYIMIYAIFTYFYENKILKAILLMFLANSIHIMTALITLLFFAFILCKKVLKIKFLYFLSMIGIVILFIPNISSFIISFVSPILPFTINSYTDGVFAGDYLTTKTLKGLIFYYIPLYIKLFFVIFTSVYLKNKNSVKNIYKFYLICFFIICFMHDFAVMFERYLAFEFIFAMILWLIYFKKTGIINLKILKFILLMVVLFFIFDFYVMRFILPETLPKLFYPTIYNLIFDSIPYEKFL